MVIEWKEREHQLDDQMVLQDPNTVLALRECGLYKYFQIPNMRSKVQLLNYIIGLWDKETYTFQVGTHSLSLEIDDIYFLTGLSKRGGPISLTLQQGGGLSIDNYVDQYCQVEAHKVSGKISIRDVNDLSLKSILYTMTQLARGLAPHLASKSQMQYSIECMTPRVFNWCEGLIIYLK